MIKQWFADLVLLQGIQTRLSQVKTYYYGTTH